VHPADLGTLSGVPKISPGMGGSSPPKSFHYRYLHPEIKKVPGKAARFEMIMRKVCRV